MEEELFTAEELGQIADEARKSIYSEPNLIHLGVKKNSIIIVDKTSGLIMVYGNSHTGFNHIIERHSLMSRKPYWKDLNKIDNPTKFSLDLTPIKYLKVASQIFKPENIDSVNNKKPDFFDVYIGYYKHRNEKEIQYKLITYKNSKIIHTLFINNNKKPFNKNKILNLRQGWVSSSKDIMNCIQTFDFKYYDYNNVPLFKVIIRYLEIDNKEKWYIQVNLEDGTPFLTTFLKENHVNKKLSMPVKMTQLDFNDVNWIEKIIKQMIDEKYDF